MHQKPSILFYYWSLCIFRQKSLKSCPCLYFSKAFNHLKITCHPKLETCSIHNKKNQIFDWNHLLMLFDYFRYSLHRNWNTTTIFILNLAAADWLYCAINLPLYAKQVGKYLKTQLKYCKDFLGFLVLNTWRFKNNWTSLLCFICLSLCQCICRLDVPWDDCCQQVRAKNTLKHLFTNWSGN